MAARRCIGMFAKMVVSGIGREGVIPNFDRDMMGSWKDEPQEAATNQPMAS